MEGGHTNRCYHDEIPIIEDTLEYVEPVIEPPAIGRVEDLSEDEGVEHESHNDLIALCRVV